MLFITNVTGLLQKAMNLCDRAAAKAAKRVAVARENMEWHEAQMNDERNALTEARTNIAMAEGIKKQLEQFKLGTEAQVALNDK